MAQYDGAIRIATKIITKDATESLASLEWQIKKSAKYMDELRSKMDALKDQKIPTQEFKDLEKELQDSYSALNILLQKQKELESLGFKEQDIPKTLTDEIDKAGLKVGELEEKISKLNEIGKAFTLGQDSAEYKAYERQLQYEEEAVAKAAQHYKTLSKTSGSYKQLGSVASDALKRIGKSITKYTTSPFKTLGNVAKSVFSNIGKSAKKSEGLLSTLGSRFKGLALSLLIFNQISKAFNAMISGMKEGFSNLYNDKGIAAFKNSVDSLKASILTLKNSFAAAFRPIVEIAIPYIQKLIDYMIQLMNVVGQFMAAITGQQKYTKAIKQTTAAIKDQNKAQNKQLSNLDSLNNLTSDMGAGADTDGGVMFEEVPIENGFKNVANKVKDIMSRFFEPLKKAWNSQGKSVMKAWRYAIDEIGRLAKRVGSDFLEVWQQSKTVKIFKDILQIIKDIGLTVGHLAKKFREAWEENDTGLHILENIRDIIGVIIANVKHAADATVKWAENLNFTPLLEAVERFTNSLEPVIDTLSGILTDFYEQVLLPLGKWTLEEGLPELLDVFTAFNEKVDWAALRENLKEFWEHLEPFAETVGEGLILFIERVSDLVANFLNSETFINFLHELEDWMDSVTPEDVADGIEKLIKALVGLKIAVIGLSALAGIAKFTVAMVQFGQAIKTVAEVISSSKIAGALASLGGIKGILTTDLMEIMGAGTATEIGLTIGAQIIAGIVGAFAGGISAKLIDNYILGPLFGIFDEELGSYYKNFKWFGEGGFFDVVTSDLETSLLGLKDMIIDFLNDPVFQGLSDMLIGPWATAAIILPEHAGKIKEIFKNTNESIGNQLGFLKDNFQKTNEAIGNKFIGLKENFKKTNKEISELFKLLGEDLSQVWTSVWKTASEKWNGILSTITSTVDRIKRKIDGFISKIKEAIQSVKDFFASGVNKIGSKISDALSFGNSSKAPAFSTRAASTPYAANPAFAALSATPIPKLATGAVIPANREFLAVLGDQKHGTNVEAPLEMIKQANKEGFLEVLNQLGLSSGGRGQEINLNLTVECEGYKLLQLIQKLDTEFFKQSGRHAFT